MNIKKIFISLFFISTLLLGGFSLVPQKTLAVEQSCTDLEKDGGYCLIEPLQIGTDQVFDRYDPKTTGIGDYVNLLIKIFIGILGVLGVIMIVLGGIQYLSTDAISKKEGGKEMITHSIFGLLLALSAFVILKTINPDLVEIRLQPSKTTPIQVVEYELELAGNDTSSVSDSSATAICSGGSIKIPGTLQKTGNVTDAICKDLGDKLVELKSKTGNLGWIITATTNGTHSSACHKTGNTKTGNCVDIALTGGVPADDPKWGTLCSAVNSISGVTFLNEASKTPGCQNIHPNVQTTYGTGSHLHIIYIGK